MTKDDNQSTIAVTITTNDSMLNMEDSIEMEMSKLKDALRQKAQDDSASKIVHEFKTQN